MLGSENRVMLKSSEGEMFNIWHQIKEKGDLGGGGEKRYAREEEVRLWHNGPDNILNT